MSKGADNESSEPRISPECSKGKVVPCLTKYHAMKTCPLFN